MSYPSTVFEGRILVYDVDRNRAEKISDALCERGYICHTSSAKDECSKELETKEYTYLFLGDIGDNISLFSIVNAAERNGVDVENFEFEGEGWSVMKAVSEIENALLMATHKRRTPMS